MHDKVFVLCGIDKEGVSYTYKKGEELKALLKPRVSQEMFWELEDFIDFSTIGDFLPFDRLNYNNAGLLLILCHKRG